MRIVTTLVSTFTLYFTSITGSYIFGIVGFYDVSNFFDASNTLSCADMSMLTYFLWYVNSDEFDFFCLASHFLPHQWLRAQESCLMSCLLFLTCGYCLPLYLAPNLLHGNHGTSSGFPIGLFFAFRTLNIPCHDESLGIRIVQLVRISWVVICVPNHNVIARLVRHLFLNIFPFSVVCDTSK